MLRSLLPKFHINTVYEINLELLKEMGIKGIITDLDNTLVGAKVPLATPELVNWLKLVETQGFRVVIVSNNSEARVKAFAAPLNLPYIFGAKKPGRTAFRRALELMQLKPEETVVIGDQMLTDVLGGNRLGLHTILVKPIHIHDEGIFTRVNRRIEKIVKDRLKKKGISPWED